MSKFRTFVFTFNNYPDTSLVDTLECKYMLYGKEISSSGTPHLQGFVVFMSPRSVSGVIKALPGCHVEPCKAPVEAQAYCKKDGDWVDRGTPPLTPADGGDLEKERWKRIREAAEDGNFHLIDDKVRVIHYDKLKRIHNDTLHSRPLGDTLDSDRDWETLWILFNLS